MEVGVAAGIREGCRDLRIEHAVSGPSQKKAEGPSLDGGGIVNPFMQLA